jgi:ATP-dependent Clp endopeptidase proteolytic subunit ClpP
MPELEIYGDIGEDWSGDGGVTGAHVSKWMRENISESDEIVLRINSVGGHVSEGASIYNMLASHKGKVVAVIDGFALSAASLIAMAADEIRMSSGAMMMIHEAHGAGRGSAADLEATASALRKMSDSAASIYAARSGKDKEEVARLMAAETWMGAEEAKSLGFCDVVLKAKSKAPSNKAAARLAAYKHLPEALRAFAESAQPSMSADIAIEQSGATRAGEVESMDDKEILKALGISNVAEGVQRLSLLTRIEAKTGKQGDEAQGLLLAALASHEQLPALQARVAELEAAGETNALEALITKAKADKKCTPAMAESVRASFAAKEITLKGAEAWLANSPVIAALNAKEEQTPPAHQGDLKHDGRSWDELKPAQRADLKRTNPELYEAMRASAN